MAKSQEDIYTDRLEKLKAEKDRKFTTSPDVTVEKDQEVITTDKGPVDAPWKKQKLTAGSP
jgi:hypothetical protein